MKVLYVTTVSRTINAFLIPHIKELTKKENRVDIACNIDLDLSKELEKNKFNKIEFSRNPFNISNIRSINQIKKLQKREKYDVIHVHTPVAAFVTRYALRKENVKIIYTAHGFHFYNGASKLNWIIYYTLEKIASRWTDYLITINNEDLKIAEEKFKNSRCSIYKINGIGIELEQYKKVNLNFKSNLDLNENDFVITVIAELIERKNHMQLIEAIKLIEDKRNLKVLFVGNGVLSEEIQNKIDRENLSNNIRLLGFRSDVPEIIKISDVVGLFSFHEGLPRNIMEGMAQGKAILCTDIRGNNDLIKDEKTGLLVKVNDYEQTKKQILRLQRDKELRKKLGGNAKKEVQNYKIENVLEEMNNIYNLI